METTNIVRVKNTKGDIGVVPVPAIAKPGIFSFFAGAGFLDLGFETSGFDTVFVNEIHKPFMESYKHARTAVKINPPSLGYFEGDIASFLRRKEGRFLQDKVDEARASHGIVGFIGGPPCPDFSVGGKNKGRDGKHGVLSRIYIDLIVKQQPDFFLFENVKGLWRTKIHREFYDELKKKLSKGGYVLTERLINAMEYGAPQYRERIILLGFNKKTFGKEVKSAVDNSFDWLKFAKYKKEVILNLPWVKTNDFAEELPLAMPDSAIEELTVEYWFKKNDVLNHPNASHYFTPRAALPKFKSIQEGDDTKKSFKRLHRWRYSPTAAYGNNEVHLHPYKARRLSVAEVLAIQSLPKEFSLPASISLSDQFKAVGNGVPYVAAKALAKTIKDFLSQIKK